MKHLCLLFVVSALLSTSACLWTNTSTTNASGSNENPDWLEGPNGLRLYLKSDTAWMCGPVRIYPIALAETALSEEKRPKLAVLTLEEAMQQPGFRITEMQDFGRSPAVWFRGLTVQNKTPYPVLLMAGDVVQGGNQDRVIAQDYIIAAKSLQNIEVFCVEAGRSHYYNPNASEGEKRLAAFYDYHSVCSPSVRQKVFAKEQEAVWEAVSQIAQANNAETPTGAYTAIGSHDGAKAQRETCVKSLTDQFNALPNVVGFVAAKGDRVMIVEIFAQPDLFRRRLKALLEGLAAEAVSKDTQTGLVVKPSEAFQMVAAYSSNTQDSNERVGKTTYADSWVHLYSKW